MYPLCNRFVSLLLYPAGNKLANSQVLCAPPSAFLLFNFFPPTQFGEKLFDLDLAVAWKKYNDQELLRIFSGMAELVAYLHSTGIAHGDLNPFKFVRSMRETD